MPFFTYSILLSLEEEAPNNWERNGETLILDVVLGLMISFPSNANVISFLEIWVRREVKTYAFSQRVERFLTNGVKEHFISDMIIEGISCEKWLEENMWTQ